MTQEQKSFFFRIFAVVGSVGLLAMSLSFIYAAFLASLGLIGIGVAALIGIAGAKFLPWLMMKIENKVLNLQMDEAAENPIETRANIAMRRREEIERAALVDAEIEAKIKGVDRDIREYKAQYPNDDVSEFEAAMVEMKRLHDEMGQNIEEAARNLQQYEAQTKMLSAKLRMALGVQDLAQAMNPNSVRKAYDKLFSETATRAVDEKFDTSMASLQQVVRKVQVAKIVENKSESGLPLLSIGDLTLSARK